MLNLEGIVYHNIMFSDSERCWFVSGLILLFDRFWEKGIFISEVSND